MLRDAWPQIAGKCGTEPGELEHAERLAGRILRAVGLREQAPAQSSAVTETRLRAFTLLTRTDDDVRRAVSFLRWREGDADAIAPSLYAGRGGRGKPDAAPEVPAPAPVTGSVAVSGGPATTTPAPSVFTPPATSTVKAEAAIATGGSGPFVA